MINLKNNRILVISAGLIEKDNKFLLVQEKKGFVYGLWNFPAGRLEFDEDLINNTIKEIKEETGYDTKIESLVCITERIDHKLNVHIVGFVFNSLIIGGKLKIPEDEILQAKWFTFEEIEKMKDKLRSPYIIESIKEYKKGTRIPTKVIKWITKN